MNNLFEQAAVVPAKTAGKAKRPDVTVLMDGFVDYAVLDLLEKQVKSMKATVRVPLDDQILDHFTEEGLKVERHPDNYKGRDTLSYEDDAGSPATMKAEGSCELRKRSSASALNEVEKSLLDKYEVPTEEVADRPATFIVDPVYADLSVPANAALLAKVSEALRIAGVPEGFIKRQEATTKWVTTDATLDAVYKVEVSKGESKAAVVKRLLEVVGTPAMKPKLSGVTDPLARAIERFGQIVKIRANEASQDLVTALRASVATMGGK